MQRKFLIGSLILFTISILCVGIGIGSLVSKNTVPSSSPSPELSTEASASGQVAAGVTERITVTRVIDGDTIELSNGKRVRYIGIDTPETVDPRKSVQCFGKNASERNKELVLNKEVELEKDVSETDRYGRLLRYVYVEYNGQSHMVNELLVTEGFATSSTFPPDVKYQERFSQAEKTAKAMNKGLWGNCPVSPAPTSSPSASTQTGMTNTAVQQSPIASAHTTTSSNSECKIKGNISSGGKIYHLPGCGSYEKTSIDESVGERWFCTEQEALDAGWRKAKNC